MSDVKLTRRASLWLPLALPVALGGCGVFDWLSDSAQPPIPGNREPVLPPARGLAIDAATDVELPPVIVNPDWPQFGGNAAHVPGNLAGGLNRVWRHGIGRGGSYRQRITAEPVVSGDQVFTMDTDGVVAAFAMASGQKLWSTPTKPKKNRSSNLGGGLACAGGRVFAATGRGELLSLDAASGTIGWRSDILAPARSSPTIANGVVYLCNINGQMLAFGSDTGRRLWVYQANSTDTGALTQAAPAYADGLVVSGFESGDLAAVHADTGLVAWSDNLGALKGSATLTEFSTVRGAPVLDDGIVYAIGLGGLMAALDLRSGRRVWDRDIAGSYTPWLAGDTLYIVSIDQKVAAVNKADGAVHWVTELPRFNNPKRTKGLISWAGPSLIGGKLILVSTNSHMAVLDPTDGKLVSRQELDSSGSLPVIAAQGKMLLLTDDGALTAYS